MEHRLARDQLKWWLANGATWRLSGTLIGIDYKALARSTWLYYMTHHQALEFAQDWIDSWNSHDLERVLSHYADDFEMNSPFICQFVNEPAGRLVGKEKIRNYWQIALSKIPDLHFQLIDVHAGATSIAIRYSNQAGKQATEVFFFGADGLVYRAAAHYSP